MSGFSNIKRCDVCANMYGAHEDACTKCGDQHHGTLLPASLFAPEPKTVEPIQPPVMAPEPRKPWSKRAR